MEMPFEDRETSEKMRFTKSGASACTLQNAMAAS